jgi:phenylacetate-CoA ligase
MGSSRKASLDRRIVAPEWETLSREEMRARQFRLLKAKLEELAATHPFYRSRWDRAGLRVDRIESLEDFARMVPTMSKGDVLADQAEDPPFGSLLGVDRSHLVQVHLTSGTSGIGQGAFGLTRADAELIGEGYTHMWAYAGLSAGDVGILTYPVTFLAAGMIGLPACQQSGLVPIFGFGVDKRVLVGLIARLGAATIFGTPGVIRELQRVAVEEGYDPRTDFAHMKAICTGLSGPPWVETIESVQEFWGVQVYEDYGSTEAGVAAVSCEYGVWDGNRRYPMHFLDNLVLCEVVDPDTGLAVPPGEVGEVVVTAYRRQASPVVRYRTGDRVVHVPYHACPCGRPFDGIVPGEISRYDDMIKVKAATVWPATVDGVVFSHREVDEYRGLVRRDANGREELVLRVAFRPDTDPGARAALLARITQEVKVATLVTPRVEEAAQLERFDFKAKRWVDERVQATATGHDRTGAGEAEDGS